METPFCIKTALFVPGDRPERIEKAIDSQSSAVIIDLEDAVTPYNKINARNIVQEKVGKKHDKPLIIRVNALDTNLVKQDIEAISQPYVFAIMVPKLSCRRDLVEVNQLILKAEKKNNVLPGSIKIIPLIESALAVENAYEIASTQTDFKRLFTLAFGAADFSQDIGVDMTKEGKERQYPRARLVMACRAAEIEAPLDTPYMLDLNDINALREDTLAAKSLGFGGKMCVHPKQIEVVNKVYSFTEKEIARAKAILKAFKKAAKKNTGAIQLDGKFIDIAIVRKAQRVLAASDSDHIKEN